MQLYPAIDLKDGQCVRLLRGAMDAATVFGDDPAAREPLGRPHAEEPLLKTLINPTTGRI